MILLLKILTLLIISNAAYSQNFEKITNCEIKNAVLKSPIFKSNLINSENKLKMTVVKDRTFFHPITGNADLIDPNIEINSEYSDDSVIVLNMSHFNNNLKKSINEALSIPILIRDQNGLFNLEWVYYSKNYDTIEWVSNTHKKIPNLILEVEEEENIEETLRKIFCITFKCQDEIINVPHLRNLDDEIKRSSISENSNFKTFANRLFQGDRVLLRLKNLKLRNPFDRKSFAKTFWSNCKLSDTEHTKDFYAFFSKSVNKKLSLDSLGTKYYFDRRCKTSKLFEKTSKIIYATVLSLPNFSSCHRIKLITALICYIETILKTTVGLGSSNDHELDFNLINFEHKEGSKICTIDQNCDVQAFGALLIFLTNYQKEYINPITDASLISFKNCKSNEKPVDGLIHFNVQNLKSLLISPKDDEFPNLSHKLMRIRRSVDETGATQQEVSQDLSKDTDLNQNSPPINPDSEFIAPPETIHKEADKTNEPGAEEATSSPNVEIMKPEVVVDFEPATEITLIKEAEPSAQAPNDASNADSIQPEVVVDFEPQTEITLIKEAESSAPAPNDVSNDEAIKPEVVVDFEPQTEITLIKEAESSAPAPNDASNVEAIKPEVVVDFEPPTEITLIKEAESPAQAPDDVSNVDNIQPEVIVDFEPPTEITLIEGRGESSPQAPDDVRETYRFGSESSSRVRQSKKRITRIKTTRIRKTKKLVTESGETIESMSPEVNETTTKELSILPGYTKTKIVKINEEIENTRDQSDEDESNEESESESEEEEESSETTTEENLSKESKSESNETSEKSSSSSESDSKSIENENESNDSNSKSSEETSEAVDADPLVDVITKKYVKYIGHVENGPKLLKELRVISEKPKRKCKKKKKHIKKKCHKKNKGVTNEEREQNEDQKEKLGRLKKVLLRLKQRKINGQTSSSSDESGSEEDKLKIYEQRHTDIHSFNEADNYWSDGKVLYKNGEKKVDHKDVEENRNRVMKIRRKKRSINDFDTSSDAELIQLQTYFKHFFQDKGYFTSYQSFKNMLDQLVYQNCEMLNRYVRDMISSA